MDFLVTQMFFDNSALYSFLYRAQQVGITVPVLPGIMPVTKAAQVDPGSHPAVGVLPAQPVPHEPGGQVPGNARTP